MGSDNNGYAAVSEFVKEKKRKCTHVVLCGTQNDW